MTHQFWKNGQPAFSNPRIKAGSWYRTSSGPITNATTQDVTTMVLTPFWPAYTGTINGFAYEMTTKAVHASGTEVVRVGIYDDDGQGRPTGSPLFQTADLDMEGTPGNVGVTTNVVSWTGIRPQLYWLAWGKFTTGTQATGSIQRYAGLDEFKDYILNDSAATPNVGATPFANFKHTLASSTLPSISALAIGTRLDTPLLLVKFA